MCDSQRSDWSASGGVSRRHDVAKGAQRISPHRFAYWRWAGFLALNFNRRTEVEFCTSVDTKPFSPPIANTMLCVRHFWLLIMLFIVARFTD